MLNCRKSYLMGRVKKKSLSLSVSSTTHLLLQLRRLGNAQNVRHLHSPRMIFRNWMTVYTSRMHIDKEIALLATQISQLRQKKACIAERRKESSDRQKEVPACSKAAKSTDVPKCKPATSAPVWQALLDALAQLTQLVQNSIHHG